jgi:hypothetical protein
MSKKFITILLKGMLIYSLIEVIRLFNICILNFVITEDLTKMNMNKIMMISFSTKILPLFLSIIVFLILKMYRDKVLLMMLILFVLLYRFYPIHIYIGIFPQVILNNILSFILSIILFCLAFKMYKIKI